MTTSVLSHCSGDLSGHDIQVLKDHAIEAPWEWRKALEALIEASQEADERVDKLDEAEARAEAVCTAAKDAIKEIREEMEAFFTTPMNAKDRTAFAAAVNKSLDELDAATEEKKHV